MITFTCPSCQKKLSVKDELAGKRVKCPGCGKAIAVPASAKATLAARTKPGAAERSHDSNAPSKTLGPVQERTNAPDLSARGGQESRAETAGETAEWAEKAASNPPNAPNPELLEFLAPAEKPDEIGRLGPYRVLQVLGAGGMGVVFRAEDPHLERVVALKAMLPALASTPLAKQRFFREAKAAAALKHANIVTIFQVGEDRGAPFLAMEFLEGKPLDKYLKHDARSATAEIVRIGREIAEGLAAAHDKGLVHRDIKPANIWLEGDKRHVKILDFGLARTLADQTHLTQSGAIIGTPAYMAPEQAEGLPVDHRCDLFSLGCVLYRMCTGELPFQGKSTMAILSALALHNPAPPNELDPELPAELSALIMRLLAKKPEDRPASAKEVVEELRIIADAHGEDRARTRPPATKKTRPSAAAATQILPRAKKKRRWLLPVGAGALLVVGAVLWIVLGRRQAPVTGPGPSADANGEALKIQVVPTPASYRDRPPGLIWSTPAGGTWWWCACFSPRGDYIAAGEDPRPGADPENIAIRVWPIKDGQMGKESFELRHPLGGKSWQTGMVFSPDGRRLASAAREGSICLWDMDATPPALLARLRRFDGILTGLAFSPDGRYFAAGARQVASPVCVWDLSNPAQPKETYSFTPKDHDEISALAFSTDSRTLFVGTGKKDVGGKLYAWRFRSEVQTGVPDAAVIWSKPFVKDAAIWVRALDSARDGSRLGLTYGDEAHIIDSKTGAVQVTLTGHEPGWMVQGIAFSADGKRCVTAGYDKTVRAWTTHDGKQFWRNNVLTGMNEGVGISPDGRLAFTSSHLVNNPAGNVAQLWRLPDLPGAVGSPKASVAPGKETGPPPYLANLLVNLNLPGIEDTFPFLTPDGLSIYFTRQGEKHGPAAIYHARRPSAKEPFGKAAKVFVGRHVAVTADECEAVVLAAPKEPAGAPEALFELKRHSRDVPWGAPTPLAGFRPDWNIKCPWLSPDGLTLVFFRKRTVSKYPGKSNEFVITHRAKRQDPWGPVQLLPLASDPRITEGLTWPRLGDNLKTLWFGHGGGRDATVLMTATRRDVLSPFDNYRTIEVAGKPLRGQAPFYVAATKELFWAHDAAGTMNDRDLHVVLLEPPATDGSVESSQGGHVRDFLGHTDQVWCVAFTPDGKRLLSGSKDKTMRLWDVQTGDELKRCLGHGATVKSVAVSADGKRILSGSWDKTARLWDLETKEELKCFRGHTAAIVWVAFHPDNKHALSSSLDKTVRVWSLESGEAVKVLKDNVDIHPIAISADGAHLVTGGGNNPLVKVWSMATLKDVQTFKGHTKLINNVAISRDDKLVLSAGVDNTLRIWNKADGTELKRLEGHCVSLSPDDKLVLSDSIVDNTLIVYDVATGKQLARYKEHGAEIPAVTMSPDGKHAASACFDSTVRLWRLPVYAGPMSSSLSKLDAPQIPPGRRLANAPPGLVAVLGTPSSDKTWVLCVAFSPDQRQVLFGGDDRLAHVWDLETDQEVCQFTLQQGVSAGWRFFRTAGAPCRVGSTSRCAYGTRKRAASCSAFRIIRSAWTISPEHGR